jgi:hypothetical protein
MGIASEHNQFLTQFLIFFAKLCHQLLYRHYGVRVSIQATITHQQWDLAPYIRDFIGVAIPMKKLHPRFDEEESPDLIFQTQTSVETEDDNNTDPRWDALKKLKKEE